VLQLLAKVSHSIEEIYPDRLSGGGGAAAAAVDLSSAEEAERASVLSIPRGGFCRVDVALAFLLVLVLVLICLASLLKSVWNEKLASIFFSYIPIIFREH
jgi:hypothetical protein